MEIEQVAENTPDKIFIENIDPETGITQNQLDRTKTDLHIGYIGPKYVLILFPAIVRVVLVVIF